MTRSPHCISHKTFTDISLSPHNLRSRLVLTSQLPAIVISKSCLAAFPGRSRLNKILTSRNYHLIYATWCDMVMMGSPDADSCRGAGLGRGTAETASRRFSCAQCNSKFSRQAHLRRHQKSRKFDAVCVQSTLWLNPCFPCHRSTREAILLSLLLIIILTQRCHHSPYEEFPP